METGRAAPLKEPFHSREDLVLFICLTLTGLSLYLLEIFSEQHSDFTHVDKPHTPSLSFLLYQLTLSHYYC